MISKASHFHIFQGSLEVEGLRLWSGFKLSQPALSSTEVRGNPGLAHPDMCVSGLLVARALRLRVILLFSIYSNISIYLYIYASAKHGIYQPPAVMLCVQPLSLPFMNRS